MSEHPQPIDMFKVVENTCDTDRPYEFQRPGGDHLAALRGAVPSACDHLFLFGTNRQFQAHLESTLDGVQIATRASAAAWARGVGVLRQLLREFLGRDRVPVIVRAHVTAARMDLTQSLVDQRKTTTLPGSELHILEWSTGVELGQPTSPLRIIPERIWVPQKHAGKRPVLHRMAVDISKGDAWISEFTRNVVYPCPHDDTRTSVTTTMDLPGITGVARVQVSGEWNDPGSWQAVGEAAQDALGVEYIAPSMQVWRMHVEPVPGKHIVVADKLVVVLEPAVLEPLWVEVQSDEFRWGKTFGDTHLGKYVAAQLAKGGAYG